MTGEPDPRLRAGGLAHLVFLTITAVAGIGAFIGLDASGLWVDELFTAHFSDPAQASLGDVVRRSAEDVHPPLYYVLIYLVRQLGLDYTISVRALSAVFGLVAVAIVYVTARDRLSPATRAFMCAFAATSWAWWRYVQEARSYTLCIVLAAIVAALAHAYQRQRAPRTLAALVLVSIVGAFVHYYMVLLAGAVFGYFVLSARTWDERKAAITGGLLVLAPVAAYVAWHTGQIVIQKDDTWFLSGFIFLLLHMIWGVKFALGSLGGMAVVLGLTVYALIAKLRTTDTAPMTWRGPVGMALLVPFITIALGLGLTFTVTPMFSYRLFLVVLPFVWLYGGLLFERYMPQLHRPALGITLVALCVLSAHDRVAYRHDPIKEELRASSAFIESLDACRGQVLPVVVPDPKPVSAPSANVFYDFYLRQNGVTPMPEYVPVNTDLALSDAWRQVIDARANDPRACPVVLWSVHQVEGEDIQDLAQRLRDTIKLPPGRVMNVVEFPHLIRQALDLPFFNQPEHLAGASIILVQGGEQKHDGEKAR